jgi:uncharacterized protein RhaS with RHS repeats
VATAAWAFTYDANGNQTVRTTSGVTSRTITWDADNRPITLAVGRSRP